MNVVAHFVVGPSGIPDVPGMQGMPGMPPGILGALEVDMELAGASISIEEEYLQSAGANLTFPSQDTSTFLLDGIYIRISELAMYPVR